MPGGARPDGLPVRVRQASLAPQLQVPGEATTGTFPAAPAAAEAVRSTMSAMQRGWERGRTAAAQEPDGPGPATAPDEEA
jgi:hypothetical protein